MLFKSLPRVALVLAASTAFAQCAESSSSKWDDASVSAPKDVVVNGFGLGCNRQLVFKRGGASSFDQTWSYSVVGLMDKSNALPADLRQNQILRNDPISVVNATADHYRGAYRLEGDDKDYSLLPIQFDGCDAGKPYDSYQLKATKDGKADWLSEPVTVKSFANPDQVLNLKATRDAKDTSKVEVSWTTYENQSGQKNDRPIGAFIIAGKSYHKDPLFSQYIEAGTLEEDGTVKVTIDVGPLPTNVSVVRYDKDFSHGFSFLANSPQVPVKLTL